MTRNYTRFFFSLLLTLFLAGWLPAQTSCIYQLELTDAFGDGWNGAQLTVTINGNSQTYTLNGIDDNGFSGTFPLTVTENDTLTLGFTGGQFPGDVGFRLLNNAGDVLFGPPAPQPVGPAIFGMRVRCATCGGPEPGSVEITRIRAFYIDVDWSPSATAPSAAYLLEYGPEGFVPGTGTRRTVNDTLARIPNLTENTDYDLYLSGLCANGDTTPVIGPLFFHTPYANDVGVVGLLEPTSSCALSAEQITVLIKNFGGAPQSFIPFNYSINGQPGSVPMPEDGVYTGVLGVDSTDEATFDIPFNFSAFGTYELLAWTELETDSVLQNDTFRITITNVPVVDELPYRESFEVNEAFWTVAPNSVNSSWERGLPGGLLGTAGSGRFVWATNADGPYNNDEFSYLMSPCFDLSGLTQDPTLSFQLFLDTEASDDEAWVEISTDGETWQKLGTTDTGVNWYNDRVNQWWDGSGGFNGWALAAHPLTGAAGEPLVRLRFVFRSDFAGVREGIAIDNVIVAPAAAVDLAVAQSQRRSPVACGSSSDSLSVNVANLGTSASNTFSLNYRVNDGEVVSENFTAAIGAGNTATFDLATPYDASMPGDYTIAIWVTAEGDAVPANDTLRLAFSTARPLPYRETFEGGNVPPGWTVDSDIIVDEDHNSQTTVLFDNLYAFDRRMRAVTPNMGPVAENDTLFFDYRFVNVGSGLEPKTLGPTDTLAIRIYVDCDPNFTTVRVINQQNHIPTAEFRTLAIPLGEYAGSAIQVEFLAGWGSGDYFVDIDNVTFRRCPPSLGTSITVTDASNGGTANGAIELNVGAGTAPFTYEWDTGDESPTLSNLLPGTYTVIITDALGCNETLSIMVGSISATDDPTGLIRGLQLAPNPAAENTWITAELSEAAEAELELVNVLGQTLHHARLGRVRDIRYQLDLGNLQPGTYFVRLRADNALRVAPLIRVGR